jgi:hypothetical protein
LAVCGQLGASGYGSTAPLTGADLDVLCDTAAVTYSVTLEGTLRRPIHDDGRFEYRATTHDGFAPEAGTSRRCMMRRTLTVIVALIGALFTLLALGGAAMAATAIEYGLIVAP